MDRLSAGAASLGIDLETEALERFFTYFSELERWNRRINLVSRSPSDWLATHFLDSLAPLSLGLLEGHERTLDLGAGAGFPGLPLKIARPGIVLVSAESSAKKCAWLRHLRRILDLDDYEVAEGRLERREPAAEAEGFQLVVSRAAARPRRVLVLAHPFLAAGGRLLVYTTPERASSGLGTRHGYRVPGSEMASVVWEVTEGEM